jgi:hypothetical protein
MISFSAALAAFLSLVDFSVVNSDSSRSSRLGMTGVAAAASFEVPSVSRGDWAKAGVMRPAATSNASKIDRIRQR